MIAFKFSVLFFPQSRPSPIGAQMSPSSDYDEFDVISNRAKTQNTNNNNNIDSTNSKSFYSPENATERFIKKMSSFQNKNVDLLDEMDPLSTSKNNPTRKTPQSFLGENSALVNLDQLIKTNPSTGPGQAAYNPFGDLSQQPKTNLFQQQMQPVIDLLSMEKKCFTIY